MGDTRGRYDDWCHTEILTYSGGGHKDGLFAEVTLVEYRWHGKDEDPRPDDAEETHVELVRKDLHDSAIQTLTQERDALKGELLCDVCLGGPSPEGVRCACWGTHKISAVVQTLRTNGIRDASRAYKAEAKIKDAHNAAIEEVREFLREMATRKAPVVGNVIIQAADAIETLKR